MIVYVVYENYSDGVEAWNSVLKLFRDKTEAELFVLEQEKDFVEGYSYYVEAMELH